MISSVFVIIFKNKVLVLKNQKDKLEREKNNIIKKFSITLVNEIKKIGMLEVKMKFLI